MSGDYNYLCKTQTRNCRLKLHIRRRFGYNIFSTNRIMKLEKIDRTIIKNGCKVIVDYELALELMRVSN